jgi:hypothetical protein
VAQEELLMVMLTMVEAQLLQEIARWTSRKTSREGEKEIFGKWHRSSGKLAAWTANP